jgi:hypothetical protein
MSTCSLQFLLYCSGCKYYYMWGLYCCYNLIFSSTVHNTVSCSPIHKIHFYWNQSLLIRSLTFKAYWFHAATGLTLKNYTFCPQCTYLFCIYLRTISDLCHLHHKLIGSYNGDEKCLLCGMDWVFIQSCLCFVFKGLILLSVTQFRTG